MNTLSGLSAAEVIRLLELKPHPEGGHYRETFRDPAGPEGRGFSTAIYYLLDVGETSEWHRVDAAEIWHHYAGAPLVITLSANGHDASAHHLGKDLSAGQRPQIVVPAGHWQAPGHWSAARSRRALPFPASRWRRRTGGRRRGRPEAEHG